MKPAIQQSIVAVKRYTPGDLQTWNEFVPKSKNATFLFNRGYMDYHSHQFRDHSLLIFVREKLSALFVANEDKDTIYSHGGLTYGGLVVENDATMEEVLRCFFHVLKYYSASFKTVVYKCFPVEFMQTESQEDIYAMFLLKAELIGRQANCVYKRHKALEYRTLKKRTVAKPSKTGQNFAITKSNDPSEYWAKVLIPNLRDRFDATPVHSVEEMKVLMQRFPSNIHLYEIRDKEILAGTIVFEMNDIVHTQYLSATQEGKSSGALDVLIDHLIMNVFADKSKFSLGTSNEDQGRKLNRGLMSWKEGFGARTRVRDIYSIDTNRFTELSDYE